MAISPRKTEKLYQKVANIIIKLIKQGVFEEGDFLPPERLLAKTLGVSRTSLRDGLIVLEISNWVKIEPGNGVIVCGDNLQSHNEDYRVDDILDSRMVIDSACARQTALLATDEEKQRISDIVSGMDQAIEQKNVREFYSLDKTFHLTIAASCRNQVLHDISKLLWVGRVNIPYAGLERRTGDQQLLRTLNDQHQHIASAIQRSDAEQAASQAMLHIHYVRQMIKDDIEQKPC